METSREQHYQQRIAQLEAENTALKAEMKTQLAQRDAQIAQLLAQVKILSEKVAKLSKNSSNSSKPPSSDIVKSPKSGPPSGPRKPGGQPGHPGVHRLPFADHQIDEIRKLIPHQCPRDHLLEGQKLLLPRIWQQMELADKPYTLTQYLRYGIYCPICDKIIYADLPEGVIEGQLFGPRLLALIGYMKGNLHTTYSGLEDFCRDVLGIDVSRSHLCNAVAKVSETLAQPYEELKNHVPEEPVLNIDESGWKNKGKKFWIWIFATCSFSVFVIDPSRSSEVLRKVLGENFAGTIVSDFFSAYVKYANSLQQFCLAHLIRDIKFLTMLPDPAEQAFGTILLNHFKWLFHFWHQREKIPPDRFDKLMKKLRDRILSLADRENLPKSSERLAKRLRKHDCALFRFLFDVTVSPTNNLAEQSIRHSVIDQRLTQGSRSEWGRKWNERIFTVVGSCRKQGRSAWQFIHDALTAHYFHTPMPSLLPHGA